MFSLRLCQVIFIKQISLRKHLKPLFIVNESVVTSKSVKTPSYRIVVSGKCDNAMEFTVESEYCTLLENKWFLKGFLEGYQLALSLFQKKKTLL